MRYLSLLSPHDLRMTESCFLNIMTYFSCDLKIEVVSPKLTTFLIRPNALLFKHTMRLGKSLVLRSS